MVRLIVGGPLLAVLTVPTLDAALLLRRTLPADYVVSPALAGTIVRAIAATGRGAHSAARLAQLAGEIGRGALVETGRPLGL